MGSVTQSVSVEDMDKMVSYVAWSAIKKGFPAELEDLKQDLWVKVLEAGDKWDASAGANEKTFAQIACEHYIVSQLRAMNRANRRMPIVSLETPVGKDGLTLGDTVKAEPSVSHGVYLGQLKDEVKKQLTEDEQALFALMAEEKTQAQIACVFGCSQPSVSAHIRRLREKLAFLKAGLMEGIED